MLVLSRKKNEAVIIRGRDGDIRIVLVDTAKGKARIGIEAPKGHTIIREEIIGEIEGANRMAAIIDLGKIKKIWGDSDG